MIGLAEPDWICSFDEIKRGGTTDIYLDRMLDVLEKDGMSEAEVTAEFSGDLPNGYEWGILAGLNEVLRLLEGRSLDVWTLPEGSVFRSEDSNRIEEPVLMVKGPYREFAALETPILGILSYCSGVATAAARVKVAAGDSPVYAFGIRRTHPALAAVADRAAYIGGLDGFSGVAAEKRLGLKATGTMPHSFILIYGDSEKAWAAFDKHAPQDITRVMLCDTYSDEKFEAMKAANLLGEKLYAVRLDTPHSRRGDFEHIVREVRWELDQAGFRYVKIMVSGSLDEYSIHRLKLAGAELFGVGTKVAAAKPVDFSMDLCEIEGKPVSKRGRFSGAKKLYRCTNCLSDYVLPWEEKIGSCLKCEAKTREALVKVIDKGKLVSHDTEREARKRAMDQSKKLGLKNLEDGNS